MDEIDLNNLQNALLRGGMQPKYARRLVEELQAHALDLIDQGVRDGLDWKESMSSAREILGDEETILQVSLAQKELKTLSHRYPKTIYLLAPLAGLILSASAIIYAVVVLVPLIFNIDFQQSIPVWYTALFGASTFSVTHLAIPVTISFMLILGMKRYVQHRWPVIGALILLFLSGGLDANLQLPATKQPGNVSFYWAYDFPGFNFMEDDNNDQQLRSVVWVVCVPECIPSLPA